jgi:hypothetical protein
VRWKVQAKMHNRSRFREKEADQPQRKKMRVMGHRTPPIGGEEVEVVGGPAQEEAGVATPAAAETGVGKLLDHKGWESLLPRHLD